MKHLFFLIALVICNCITQAQTKVPTERIVIIANVENGEAKTVDYVLSDLRIESKIIRAFRLDGPKLKLVNPTITNQSAKEWFIQYEFESDSAIGLWKEQLQLRNGQLVITESRNARISIASNCQKIEFTNDEERCKCAEKKNVALDSEVTFRVFSSMN